MKNLPVYLLLLIMVNVNGTAQDIWMTRTGQISFFSKTPMENIEAINNDVNSMINTKSGEVVFAVLIKSFRFEKALMEEHFNENYMESDKLPKSSFQGRIVNFNEINFSKNGDYKAVVEGDLTLHGVKQKISTEGTIKVLKDKIEVEALFFIKLSDYKIERPSLVAAKISEKIDIKIKCLYEPKL